MKIVIGTPRTECRPVGDASRALAAMELLERTGEVDLAVEWMPCQRCGSIHGKRERCSRVSIVCSWMNPFSTSTMNSSTIRLYQFGFLYLMYTLTTILLVNLLFQIFINPAFDNSSANDTLLPVGHAHSSFVFSIENKVRVGRVEIAPCGSDNQTIQVDTLKWSPPAVSLSSPVFVNMSVQVFEAIEAPVEVSVEVSRFVFVTWVTVPCIDDLGSCTYKDVCALSSVGALPCSHLPDNFHLPCACPVKAGEYFIKNGELQLPGSGLIPEWLTRGWFKAAVKVRDPVHNKQLACYQAKVHIE